MSEIQINIEKYKKSNWTENEIDNVKLVISFVQHLMNNHEFDLVEKKFNNSLYKQHNRNIPDGMVSLIKYVKDFVKQYPDYVYDVKHIHADGDFVIFHSHITIKKKDRGNDAKGINVSDTWKIQNGMIVEHWDSLQPINGFMRFLFWLIGGKIANRNGVF